MNISSVQLRKNIHDVIFEWQKLGLVFDSRNHEIYQKANQLVEVSWGNDGFVLKNEAFSTISEYCSLVDNKQYSIMLSDGSLIQISYNLKRNKVVKHRLCWYPAPVSLDVSILEESSASDYILDKMSDASIDEFIIRSPIRFDYDPKEASETHPESHMHISNENCRIPVRTPLCLRKFIKFIVSNFYPDIEGIDRLVNTGIHWPSEDRLTENQKKNFHINIFEAL